MVALESSLPSSRSSTDKSPVHHPATVNVTMESGRNEYCMEFHTNDTSPTREISPFPYRANYGYTYTAYCYWNDLNDNTWLRLVDTNCWIAEDMVYVNDTIVLSDLVPYCAEQRPLRNWDMKPGFADWPGWTMSCWTCADMGCDTRTITGEYTRTWCHKEGSSVNGTR